MRRQEDEDEDKEGAPERECTLSAVKGGVGSKVRLLLPRVKSWRLCYDGVREKTRTERLMGYFRDTIEGEGGADLQMVGYPDTHVPPCETLHTNHV